LLESIRSKFKKPVFKSVLPVSEFPEMHVTVPDSWPYVHLAPLYDVHIGHQLHDAKLFARHCKWLLEEPYVLTWDGGDMIENASKLSIGAGVYEQDFDPQNQLVQAAKQLAGLHHKMLFKLPGNHEDRTLIMGVDVGQWLAWLLDIPYFADYAFITIKFAGNNFRLLAHHGTGAAQTAGGQLMAARKDIPFFKVFDLYWTGHIHSSRIDVLYQTDFNQRTGLAYERNGLVIVSPSYMRYFNCVDEKTECLTEEGWKGWDKIRGDEFLPTMNLETRRMEWQQCEDKFVRSYAGPMAHIHNRHVDMLLTPNHRVVAVDDRSGKIQVRCVDEMPPKTSSNLQIPQVLNPLEARIPLNISPELASVLGWVISEGHYDHGGRIEISQSNKKNPRYVQAIRLALSKAGFHAKIDSRYLGITRFYIPKEEAPIIKTIIPDKLLTPELVFGLPIHQAKKLFAALMRGDGHYGTMHNWSWKQKNRTNRDLFQALGFRLGENCPAYEQYESVSVRSGKTARWQARNSDGGHRPIVEWDNDYAGLVWCVSTPNTTFVARRSGKIFITGNSYAAKKRLPPGLRGLHAVTLQKDGRIDAGVHANGKRY
jgi:hypothetical protein